MDEFYAQEMGIRQTPSPKPKQFMPEAFRALIEHLERAGPPGFIDAVELLLECSGKAREEIAKFIVQQRKRGAATGFAGFRMPIGDKLFCYCSSPQSEPEMAADYVKASKYAMRSSCAIGIAQARSQPEQVCVFIEDYPWTEDSQLAELTLRLLGRMNSRTTTGGSPPER